ncbi:hypothetical protein [Lentilactobacillus parakefiri]|uniref:hypothetical protein n=1 Tax=Lentilactobacillus parakefiri TaxID=152332 RepID=UPI001CDACDB8|nr:hypothetical protein [Lentilactobacillus parakefiri]
MNRAKCAPRLTSLLAVLLGLFVFQTTTYANTSNEMTDPSPTSANVSDQPTATVDGPSVSATSDVETDQPVNDPAATSASTTETDYSADDASTDSGDSTTQPSDSESKDNQPAVDDVQASKQAENNPQPTVENGTASPNSTASQQPETTTSDNNASQKTATPSANDRITIDDANNPDNPAWKQSSNNPLINFITGITSTIAAGVVYPFAASRQGAALLSKIRTLMSPDRYNVDQMWSDLDSKYDPAFTKTYYTDAKNWYDNEVSMITRLRAKCSRYHSLTGPETLRQPILLIRIPPKPLSTVKVGPPSRNGWVISQKSFMTWATTSSCRTPAVKVRVTANS